MSDEYELPDNWAEMSPYERVQWRMKKEALASKQLEIKANACKVSNACKLVRDDTESLLTLQRA